MSLTHTRPFSRLATQLATITIIGILAYAVGYRRGSHFNENAPSPALAEAHPKPATGSQSPIDGLPTESENAPPEIQQADVAHETPIDWKTRGYDAGRSGFEAGLEHANSLNGRDQAFFIAGLFSYIAEFSSPQDALTIASSQTGPIRVLALKALVSEWTADSLNSDERENRSRRLMGLNGSRQGLEVELASILARSKPDPVVAQAWMEAFSDHPGRSEIAAQLVPAQADYNPDSALALAENWTDWEKERFSKRLLTNWAQQNPKDAWNWYSENQEQFPKDLSSELLDSWAQKNAQEVISSLDSIEGADGRLQAVEAISASLARQGTAIALDWVEGLANSEERDAGLQAIYEATPKGIGALLSMEDGFPLIKELLPGGALEGSGIMAGDLIVESRESGGEPNDLYGMPLGETVGFLRGDPGSAVEIRVLRKNETTGNMEEHTVTVERDLLILDHDAKPNDIDRH